MMRVFNNVARYVNQGNSLNDESSIGVDTASL